MEISEQLLDEFNYVIVNSRLSNRVNDAEMLSILRDHLIDIVRIHNDAYYTNVAYNTNDLLAGIKIAITKMNKYLKELYRILSYSNVMNYVSNEVINLMYEHCLGMDSVSDIFFERTLMLKSTKYLKEHIEHGEQGEHGEKDIITSYSRFLMVLTQSVNECTNKFRSTGIILEDIILDHEDYFLRSIEEYPELIAGSGGVHKHIWDEYINELIQDNIPFNEEVFENAVRNSDAQADDYYIKYLTIIPHHPTLTIRIYRAIVWNEIESLYGSLCNKYDVINFFEPMRISDTAAKKDITHVIDVLIHDEHVIEQAKNYHPRCIQHESDKKLWKLNFMRMFTFKGNLLRISTSSEVDKS